MYKQNIDNVRNSVIRILIDNFKYSEEKAISACFEKFRLLETGFFRIRQNEKDWNINKIAESIDHSLRDLHFV